MRIFITGCAGFIGSNLTDRLLREGHEITGYDNLTTGSMEFLKEAEQNKAFTFVQGDILDPDLLTDSMRQCDFVYHLAANADVRFGTDHPRKDLEQNTIGTFNVLESMRKNKIRRIVFSSTGSIYGETVVIPTPENAPFPVQTSLYGASKLACEGLIAAYCEGFGLQAWIFRFVSILGERYTHGHVFDFYKNLLANPRELRLLGDGHQKKSYLYVQDCLDAIFLAVDKAEEKVNIFNLGTDEYCEINDSVKWITGHLGCDPALTYAGGTRGWIGDNPFIFLDCAKIHGLGWTPKLKIKEAVIKTTEFLANNQWVFKEK
ncbi:MAG: nucleoside-diphosphate sugar epimerase [Elusimicrobia bacterium RIFOXYA12_FULL_51_18]|nr:MAG: nucleoside-diphosphate sugar epimerase [Elusimicrobia bacterium RIFOXYA12_FULL_51_18]OGS31497.1 MAG: nucleoside-diphosphate sugar epimerase [Elusimicrobia bacterium RIFOXYA2_FULL_53_38]